MQNEFILLLPLILITGFSILAVLTDAVWKRKNVNFFFALFSLILVIASSIYILTIPKEFIEIMQNPITHGQINFGGYTYFLDILFSFAGILTILAARPYLRREYIEYNEFSVLILFSICGMMVIVHSSNFLILFVGIELMSLSFYILAGFFRKSIYSVEAALKYLLLGAFATGFLVYGIALIYGATLSLDYSLIFSKIQSNQFQPVFLTIGTGLLIVGMSFKSAAFPFHQWAPDVYHGSPTVVTGFMSTAGKAAAIIAFAVIIKSISPLISVNGPNLTEYLPIHQIIAAIAAATMLVGNITALVQKNIKRMLAYSSVAHAGYLMIGIAAANAEGWQAILFYSVAYLFMQMGCFAIISVFERNNNNLQLDDWAGLGKVHPWLAASMAIFMFSLAGMPPFAGFFGKYYLFVAAIKADMLWLAIVGIVSSIISMYFYIGLIIQMYFKDREHALEADTGFASITIIISVVAILLFGLFPMLIINIA